MSGTALEIKMLSKSFGSFKAVDELSLSVRQGEIFSLLGPNGAGKTTTINLITGVLQPDKGSIELNGISAFKSGAVLNRIGVCTQEKQIWPLLTCEEQLQYMGHLYRINIRQVKKRALDLLEIIGLSDKRKVLAKNLSGGMQRRLHMIMSVVHDPDIIVLDEPEAGLDPQSRVLVRNFIKYMSETKTVLLTTHNMDEAERLSSRVAIMDKGKVLVCDTPAMLRKKIAPEETLEIVCTKPVTITSELIRNNYSAHAQGNTIRVTGDQLTVAVPDILKNVIGQFGNPVTFSLRQSTLEDVFIKLTGRNLRE